MECIVALFLWERNVGVDRPGLGDAVVATVGVVVVVSVPMFIRFLLLRLPLAIVVAIV